MVMLHVLMNGHQIGTLTGAGRTLRFMYDPPATRQSAFVPLSLAMPATQARWKTASITPWLRSLLPDRDGVLMRWRAQFGVRNLNPESLLEHVGEDVAGAAQFVRPDRLDAVTARQGSVVPLAEVEIGDVVRAAREDSLPYDDDTATGRFSLAGAQVKFALQRTATGWGLPSGAEPSTDIFKPGISGLDSQDVSEVVTMRTASELGLATAHASIATFDGERVIRVERYDRARVDGRWWRIHQEDLCQAAGANPQYKYENQGGPGVAACARIIAEHCGRKDVDRFARAVIFNYLVRGSDAHARNYSLLLTPGDIRLAPLYDLNATLSFGSQWARRMAMRIGGEERFDSVEPHHWSGFARDLNLDEPWVRDQVAGMARDLPEAVAAVRAAPDIVGVDDRTTAILQDRAADWCRAVVGRISRPAGTRGSLPTQVRDDPGHDTPGDM